MATKKIAPSKVPSKSYDLWGGDGDSATMRRPVRTQTSEGDAPLWTIDTEMVPRDQWAARKVTFEDRMTKPNKRAAVKLPHAGQSYNPTDDSHQDAMKVAVVKLEKKKKDHERFVSLMAQGKRKNSDRASEGEYKGDLNTDKMWEEAVVVAEVKEKTPVTKEEKDKRKVRKDKAKLKQKKKNAKRNVLGVAKETRRSLHHRRHPDRMLAKVQLADIDKIKDQLADRLELRALKNTAKKIRNIEGQTIKSFGRHHHQPLTMEVAPTEKLVGSLRHMKSSQTHPAMDRLKSLEERNLIPARMRHTYSKRKQLMNKGEVRIATEQMGIRPE